MTKNFILAKMKVLNKATMQDGSILESSNIASLPTSQEVEVLSIDDPELNAMLISESIREDISRCFSNYTPEEISANPSLLLEGFFHNS